MLTDWNFADEAANSATQQINRQKSARNLDVREIDHSAPRAVFYDPGRRETHIATLTTCDCRDFNFASTAQRKTFKPCMHIYRLAMELTLIEPKYLNHAARVALFGSVGREETGQLQQLTRDQSQWGGWPSAIHTARVQRDRQFRAREIVRGERDTIQPISGAWHIHDYTLTLSACECMDFRDRRLPCKHIYAAALVSSIALPFTETDYDAWISQGISISLEFPTSAKSAGSILESRSRR
jgi:hypothetical protein